MHKTQNKQSVKKISITTVTLLCLIISREALTWSRKVHFLLFLYVGTVRTGNEGNISSRIAGPGELFSSDFQACAQSPR